MKHRHKFYEERTHVRKEGPIQMHNLILLPPCIYETLTVQQRHTCTFVHKQWDIYIPRWAFLRNGLEQIFIDLAVIAEKHSLPLRILKCEGVILFNHIFKTVKVQFHIALSHFFLPIFLYVLLSIFSITFSLFHSKMILRTTVFTLYFTHSVYTSFLVNVSGSSL